MVDDMGFSDIDPCGSEIPTPHLDAIAAGGAKFSQFFHTGRCCPTRASLLTGLYSHQAGTDLWTRQGLSFVDEAIADDQPFFGHYTRVAAHFPGMAPEVTIAKYRGKYRKGWDRLREQRYARQVAAGLIEPKWKLEARPESIPAWDCTSFSTCGFPALIETQTDQTPQRTQRK